MSERQLLLPSAKTQLVLAKPTEKPYSSILRAVFVVLGILVVVYGALDLWSRASLQVGGSADPVVFVPSNASLPGTGTAPSAFLTTTESLVPVKLIIPSIGVNAHIESVGTDSNGAMKTPSTFGSVAWYKLGSKPGEAGNAVIDGHVNNALTQAGVFEHLSDIAVGATVEVASATGKKLTYQVRDIEDYSTDNAPTDVIFSRSGPSQLVLITCAGDWDAKAHSFNKRLVVFATLKQQ